LEEGGAVVLKTDRLGVTEKKQPAHKNRTSIQAKEKLYVAEPMMEEDNVVGCLNERKN